MAGAEKAKEAAQGAASSESKQGAMDLEQPKGEQLVAETPEWAQAILDSNAEVLESNAKLAEQNRSVIDNLQAFKGHTVDFIKQLVESTEESNKPVLDAIKEALSAITVGGIPSGTGTAEQAKPSAPKIDPELNYHVTTGNSFRDSHNFAKEYREGDNVTHLGEAALQRLLDQGLVDGIPREEA